MSVTKDGDVEVFTVEEFRKAVRSGCFNAMDGGGFYGGDPSSNEDDADLPVDLDVITTWSGHTHVWWYNK